MRFRKPQPTGTICGKAVAEALGGDPERIRTSDLQIRNLPLYPAELRGLLRMCLNPDCLGNHGAAPSRNSAIFQTLRALRSSRRKRERFTLMSLSTQPLT
jgi:hypothetical protein